MSTIRKRGNKWQVQVRKHGYSPFSKSFTNRKDAELWAKSVEIQLEKGLLPSDNHNNTLKNLTLGQLVQRYIENVTVHKKSCHMETTILKAFLRHPICSISLKKLSSEDFARYRDERLQKIKPETLKRQLTPLKSMFKIARNEWNIPIESPLDKVSFKVIEQRRERRLQLGEFEKIIAVTKLYSRNELMEPIIRFAIETGMRRGEILAFTWQDIDFVKRSLIIRESKNGYKRNIPLTANAIHIIQKQLPLDQLIFNCERDHSMALMPLQIDTDLRHEALLFLIWEQVDFAKKILLVNSKPVALSDSSIYALHSRIKPDKGLVFPLSPNAFNLAWQRLIRKTGIKDLRFHDLRHEAISRFFERGLNIPEVASISGHRDPKMLFRYTHPKVDDILRKLG